MSTNRSVQAAQRRRAGPTNAEPSVPGRGPQPSIHSSKIFAGQPQQPKNGFKEVQETSNKMTVAQAITLITLRLGSVETKLMSLQENGGLGLGIPSEGHENMVLVDKSVIDSIAERLENLESRPVGASNSISEIGVIKQNLETIRQTIMKTNGVTNTLIKENKDFKTYLENLKTNLNDTKSTLDFLQNITMDNSQKLLELNSQSFQNLEYSNELEVEAFEEEPEEDDNKGEKMTRLNLKELIETEINDG